MKFLFTFFLFVAAAGQSRIHAENVWADTLQSPAFSRPVLEDGFDTDASNEVSWLNSASKHAPLAFFSAASLAVGGVLFAIRSENPEPMQMQAPGGDRDLGFAMGGAALVALIAGGSFWYYTHADYHQEQNLLSMLRISAPVSQSDGKWAIAMGFSLPGL